MWGTTTVVVGRVVCGKRTLCRVPRRHESRFIQAATTLHTCQLDTCNIWGSITSSAHAHYALPTRTLSVTWPLLCVSDVRDYSRYKTESCGCWLPVQQLYWKYTAYVVDLIYNIVIVIGCRRFRQADHKQFCMTAWLLSFWYFFNLVWHSTRFRYLSHSVNSVYDRDVCHLVSYGLEYRFCADDTISVQCSCNHDSRSVPHTSTDWWRQTDRSWTLTRPNWSCLALA